MAKHLVTMLVGVIVEAPDADAAKRKARLPFDHGLLPGVIGVVPNGARLATETDTPELFAERLAKATA